MWRNRRPRGPTSQVGANLEPGTVVVSELHAKIREYDEESAEEMMKTILLCLMFTSSVFAQSPPQAAIPIRSATLPLIEHRAIANDPLSVAGPRGALLGTQDGRFEAWIYPWKIFDNIR